MLSFELFSSAQTIHEADFSGDQATIKNIFIKKVPYKKPMSPIANILFSQGVLWIPMANWRYLPPQVKQYNE